VTVLIPYPVLVEVAAVLTRLAERRPAERVVESLEATSGYIIVYEEEYRRTALRVALVTGCSGFDAYIIALAKDRNALLITDDNAMSGHARALGVDNGSPTCYEPREADKEDTLGHAVACLLAALSPASLSSR